MVAYDSPTFTSRESRDSLHNAQPPSHPRVSPCDGVNVLAFFFGAFEPFIHELIKRQGALH